MIMQEADKRENLFVYLLAQDPYREQHSRFSYGG